ncbi:MAG: sulfatase-like hydrolase/transferase, partial [Phycisphaeraceae bacterium]
MSCHKPNVVFIFADQLSARHCGPYGNEHVRTPTMDRMAERGVVFENFYANSAQRGPSRNLLGEARYAEAVATFRERTAALGFGPDTDGAYRNGGVGGKRRGLPVTCCWR